MHENYKSRFKVISKNDEGKEWFIETKGHENKHKYLFCQREDTVTDLLNKSLELNKDIFRS